VKGAYGEKAEKACTFGNAAQADPYNLGANVYFFMDYVKYFIATATCLTVCKQNLL